MKSGYDDFSADKNLKLRGRVGTKLLVLIPAYNEADRISKVISGVRSSVGPAEILVIDDGSTDRTAEVAESCGIRVLRLDKNRGYGAALQAGYKAAREEDVDVLVQLDADGQHDPKSIRSLLAALEDPEVEVVIGSRFLSYRKYQMPLIRRIGLALFRLLLLVLTRRKYTDPTSGFQAIRGSALTYYTSDYFPADYPDANVIFFLWKAGIRVVEAPAVFHPSPDGKKPLHSGFRPLIYVLKMLGSLFMTLVRPIPKELRGERYKSSASK